MIFGIVVLHIPPYVPLPETGPSFFDSVKAFFQHAVFRTSVPVLTFISGYLLFNSRLDINLPLLAKKKIKTLLVPLILFNLPLVICIYIIQLKGVNIHDFSEQLVPFDLFTWVNATIGISSDPVNYPLSFLRDLFLISLLSPIFGWAIRHMPYVGFIAVFAIFWFDLDGPLVIRNTMPILFYAGGLASTLRWDMRKLDQYGIVLLSIFIGFCLGIILFEVENRNYLRIISPLLIWPAISLIADTKFGYWIASISKRSFFLFLVHGPIVFAFWLLYKLYLAAVPYWLFWIVTPVITALLIAKIDAFLHRAFPGFMKIALGGR